MLPILLIHGYSTEGKNNKANDIYGDLPDDLTAAFGPGVVKEINLSRWVSLDDGVAIDDIAFALDRALRNGFPHLLESGFHVIIHSTGALVTRTWIRNYSPKPCPIVNLIHLAGANLGSGLAHIGRGQLVRWCRGMMGTDVGLRVLQELEFGSGKTIDLHLYFLEQGQRMFEDYQVQEFCLVGSQIPKSFRNLPIRYTKEDNSDCTVRAAAANLNFNYVKIVPSPAAYALTATDLLKQLKKRMKSSAVSSEYYHRERTSLAGDGSLVPIPFAIPFETAHISDDLSIVYGAKNRNEVLPLITEALTTKAFSKTEYQSRAAHYQQVTATTYDQAKKLPSKLLEWNPQEQYEAHAMVIFRIRDQYGNTVPHFDLFIQSQLKHGVQIEKLMEDTHVNKYEKGTITLYFRIQEFKDGQFNNLLDNAAPTELQLTGHEAETNEIAYVPFSHTLSPQEIRQFIIPFQTTIIDIVLLRLPTNKVVSIVRK